MTPLRSVPHARRGLRGFAPLALAAVALAPFALLAACSSDEGGCTKDIDCKGDRICASGECVDSSTASTGSAGGGGSASTGGNGSGGSGGTPSASSASASSSAASTGSGQMCDCGKIDCGGSCVDTATSNDHCGGCGKACAFNETCVSAKCQANLGPGYSWVATGTKSEAVMTGSCSKSGTTTA
ncbi:MAG: hypothetical protein FJ096_20665, partial [Deltaproteobacteria bacterium]|nr:hypothetical protein [Deltaproteobacteria bacterium]